MPARAIARSRCRSAPASGRRSARSSCPPPLPGIVTGLILGLGRAIGETAAVIFTAGSSLPHVVPTSLFDGTRTLSVHFYQLAREGISADKAYATAAVLVLAISLINVACLRRHEPLHAEVPVSEPRPRSTSAHLTVPLRRRVSAVRGVDLAVPAHSIYAIIGPARQRQDLAAAHHQPALASRSTARRGRRGRSSSTGGHPARRRRPGRASPPDRHGVRDAAAAAAAPSTTTSSTGPRLAGRPRPRRARRARRVEPARGAALGRGQGSPRALGLRAVGRPAAAPLHRADARARARGRPARRAVLGPRSHLHPQDRGDDARAHVALHLGAGHQQHQAGGARQRPDRLPARRRAGRGGAHRPALHRPSGPRTGDYVEGRFG